MKPTAKRYSTLLTLLLALFIALSSGPSATTPEHHLRQSGAATTSGEYTGKTPAQPGAQPWMVALVNAQTPDANEGQFCGASLISSKWVLTAAHCVEGETAASVDAVIGRNQLSTQQGERIHAKRIIVHPGYVDQEDGQANDIALIELNHATTAGQPISIINAATAAVDDAGAQARITGWGRVPEKNLDHTDKLFGVNVPVMTQQACQKSYDNTVSGDEICAGLPQGGKDSCEGDSGGPLFIPNAQGKAIQIGIVSWGGPAGCGMPNNPGVYTRLTEYENWIKAQMSGDSTNPAPTPDPTPTPDSTLIDPATVLLPEAYTLVDAQSNAGERYASFETPFGDYADISVFDTDDASLVDWLAGQDDAEDGEIIEVQGVKVLVLDKSDAYGPVLSAVFLAKGQLVFLDATLAQADLVTAIISLIN